MVILETSISLGKSAKVFLGPLDKKKFYSIQVKVIHPRLTHNLVQQSFNVSATSEDLDQSVGHFDKGKKLHKVRHY